MNLELGDENSWVEYVSKYWHSACNGGEGGGGDGPRTRCGNDPHRTPPPNAQRIYHTK